MENVLDDLDLEKVKSILLNIYPNLPQLIKKQHIFLQRIINTSVCVLTVETQNKRKRVLQAAECDVSPEYV